MHTKTPAPCGLVFAASALHRLLAGAGFSLAAIASAQTPPSGEDTTLKLAVFEVTTDQDVGYLASNSVSATRINTPIKDLPFSISAFTPQFMADINARDLFDVVRYAPGVTTGGREFTGGNASYVIRGFNQAPEIDGFTSGAAGIYVDTANIERVEVVKGPASILYGGIAPGGTVNYITKRAKPDAFANVAAEAGSYNYKRATIDVNRPIIKNKLLFRINGAWENNYQYENPSQAKSWVVAPTVTWNMAKNLTLTVSDQVFQRRETPPALFLPNMVVSTPTSMASALNAAFGYPTPVSALAGGKSGPDSLLNNPSGNPATSVINDGNDLGFLLYYPALAKTFNYSAKSDRRLTDTNYFNAELDAKFGDHWAGRGNFDYNAQRDTQKVTGIGTVGIAPPGSMTFNGTTWAVSPTWTALSSAQQNAAEQALAHQLLAHPYSVQNLIGNQPAILPRRSRMVSAWGHGLTGQFDLAGQYDFGWVKLKPLIGVYYDKTYAFMRTNSNSGTATSPFFQAWDLNPNSPTAFADGGSSVFNASTLPLVPGSSTLTFTSDQAVYGIINASFFHDRFFTIAGLRYNRSQNQSIQEFGPLTGAAQQGLKKSANTPQLGLGYKAVKDALLYASYSESYALPATSILRVKNTPVGPAAPTIGEGIEAGIKTDFFNGRLSSTLSVYRIEQKDLVLTTANSSTGTTLLSDVQGESAVSKGIEYEVTLSPTDDLQIYTSVAEDDIRIAKVPFGQLVYLGSHPQGTAKTLANLWVRYTFKHGPAAGLWAGGGFNYNAKSVGDARNPYFFVPSYILWNSAVGYDWRWPKIGWSATVNWQNMTNKFYIPANQQVGLPSRVSVQVAVKF